MFAGAHLERLEEIMREVCTDFETGPAEFNRESNHAHLLVNFPPKGCPLPARQLPQRRVLTAD